jgi:hypothetical protein
MPAISVANFGVMNHFNVPGDVGGMLEMSILHMPAFLKGISSSGPAQSNVAASRPMSGS